MSGSAQFWSVDFHVHTPASSDTRAEDFGTSLEIVQAALDAGLDAIVVTDHNTAESCEPLAAAAAGTNLTVLPGVEISTTEGHLLALWDIGTPASVINDLLATLGITTASRGRLDITANAGIAEAARSVARAGGLAIAAHSDKQKGVLSGITVAAHLRETLMEPCLAAVELVHLDRANDIYNKVGDARVLAVVRGSDTWDPARSCHSLSGIGSRRTWIKAGRPDLAGIRHALADPELRVLLGPPNEVDYPTIHHVDIRGGFLGGQKINLSPDLNCLLGGTGAGKSLILECIRFALDQQVSRADFANLRTEVDSRLESALGEGGSVVLEFSLPGKRYRVSRSFSVSRPEPGKIYLQTGDEWAEVELDVTTLLPLAAFSQGEILEYSRRPVGRMSLIDSGIDSQEIESSIEATRTALRANATSLLATTGTVQRLKNAAAGAEGHADRVRQLGALFDKNVVQAQGDWTAEQAMLDELRTSLSRVSAPKFSALPTSLAARVDENSGIFTGAASDMDALNKSLQEIETAAEFAITAAVQRLADHRQQWDTKFHDFQRLLDEELERVGPGQSLGSLRLQLQAAQRSLSDSKSAHDRLEKVEEPALRQLLDDREQLLNALHDQRKKRRTLRRDRVDQLNVKAAGFVRLDIPSAGDDSEFRAALEEIKVGSRVKDSVLASIARTIHPIRFVREMWMSNVNSLANDAEGIDAVSLAKLLSNISERDLWSRLFDIQLIDRPDILTVKFKKPEDGTYSAIETLAHGQRCTAILVILLADGKAPVLIDQPEDALHAPWIEEYLVDRLRSLRGTRQYLFATRSPGIVVSADAEQIVTMRATSGHGEVEDVGSLERHNLNHLVMHHLEGGPVAFDRRARKLLQALPRLLQH